MGSPTFFLLLCGALALTETWAGECGGPEGMASGEGKRGDPAGAQGPGQDVSTASPTPPLTPS